MPFCHSQSIYTILQKFMQLMYFIVDDKFSYNTCMYEYKQDI